MPSDLYLTVWVRKVGAYGGGVRGCSVCVRGVRGVRAGGAVCACGGCGACVRCMRRMRSGGAVCVCTVLVGCVACMCSMYVCLGLIQPYVM